MNCYLSRNYKGLSSAGDKAKTDIEQIMSEAGFKNVGFKQTTYANAILAFLSTLFSILKAPFCLHASDCLVLQYPLKKYFSFVCNLAHLRNTKVIVVIHDLGSFRRRKLTIAQEIKRLSRADYIIAHNETMRNWLIDNGCQVEIGTLNIFDYLSLSPIQFPVAIKPPYKIFYAGGLNYRKNAFLYEAGNYIHSYLFYLYGNGFEIEKAKGSEHLRYMGFIQSDQLISSVQGNFGLVWDGTSTQTCTGDFGEYLRYNNPHKTSLYLRCGLPVVIWKQAALANFIEQNKIGLCIESLNELDSKLQSLTIEEYQQIRKNAYLVGKKIAEGYFIKQALQTAITYINSKKHETI